MKINPLPGMTDAETLGYLIGRALPVLVVVGNDIDVPNEQKLRITALEIVHEIKSAMPEVFEENLL